MTPELEPDRKLIFLPNFGLPIDIYITLSMTLMTLKLNDSCKVYTFSITCSKRNGASRKVYFRLYFIPEKMFLLQVTMELSSLAAKQVAAFIGRTNSFL